MNPGDLAHSMVQGSDTAGLWVAEDGSTSLLGVPVRTSVAIASKTALTGEW